MKTILSKTLPVIVGLSLVCFLYLPQLTFAADPATDTAAPQGVTFTPLTQLPQIQSAASADSLPVFLNQLYKICIGIGTVLAFFMIIRAGIEIMVSRGSVSSNEKAKSHLQGAVLGLILLLAPVVVFSIINPDILNLKLDFGGLQSTKDLTHLTSPTGAGTQTVCSASIAIPNDQSCSTKDSSLTEAAASCCENLQNGYKCCSKTINQFLLAYKFDITPKAGTVGNACIEHPRPQYFSSEQACKTQLENLPSYIKAGSSNYSFSNLQVLKSCEPVKDLSYKIPDEANTCSI
jgi:hypothetical protein